ncbi:MAG: ABC transporter ATP-binding protein [Candidatus Saccharibacteria bacterium]
MISDYEKAVAVKDLHKTFRLPHEQHSGIKQRIINIFKGVKGYEVQRVLDDISFEIKKGEFFGIVGRNGSGKSTLLKLLASIYVPDKGLIKVNGSLTPFIELGVGFNPELSGRENVFLNGALLGFSRAEMEVMYDGIVEFAELEKFMDQKLKNYSSGMQVRLAFSIAIRAQSDILLIDEVLAVGDAAFQQKCYNYFDKLKKSDKTVILVTHDMGVVKLFCDRALMLENGKIIKIGKPKDVSIEYEKSNFAITESSKEEEVSSIKAPIKVYDRNNKPINRFKFGDDIILSIEWPKSLNVGIVGFSLSKNGETVFATNTINQDVDLTNGKARLKLKPSIGDGRYLVTAGLFGETRHDVIDFIQGPEIVIDNQPKHSKHGDEWQGISYVDNEWQLNG